MGLNFHFFPAAFHDETLHSILSRYALLSGLRSCKALFDGAESASCFSQNVAFPCRLGELISALPSGTELPLAEVIKRHTLLPYYQPFLSPQQVADAHALMEGNGMGLMLRLGLTASRLEFASRVRFCPACIYDDTASVGAAYWHRIHQLPGVLLCPHHDTVLRILDHRWLSRTSRRLHLPDSDEVQDHSLLLDIPMSLQPALCEVARRSLHVLETDVPSTSPRGIRSVLLGGATALGLASNSGRLNLGRLAQHLSDFFKAFPSSWEYSMLAQSSENMPAVWVQKLLHKPRHTHHPLKFILLASALKVDMSRLMRVTEPIELPSSSIDLLKEFPASETDQLTIVSDASKAIWVRALGGACAADIASELGISVTCVYRSIRAIENGSNQWKQARWLKQLGNRRSSFETEYLNHLAHQCRDYAWLYRNDRQWLLECTQVLGKARSTREQSAECFRKLDLDLAKAIVDCAEKLRALPGKPVFISRTKIGREIHALSRLEKQLKKLPRCAAALVAACESKSDFHDRRLRWAFEKLHLEGRRITRSLLYRTANIRPSMETVAKPGTAREPWNARLGKQSR